MPKFLYGTHYSGSGAVLHYLIRLEPFANLNFELQSGKFDHADRLFSDACSTWRSVKTNSSDVKQLVPEWFYSPQIFKNMYYFFYI